MGQQKGGLGEPRFHPIQANSDLPDPYHVVNPKKNSPQPVTKAIRLKPSLTDYATFVATTSKVPGTTAVSWMQQRVKEIFMHGLA